MTTTPHDATGSGSEPMFFDREGHPVDLSTYLRLYADPTYRFLARDTVPYARVDPRVGDLIVVTAWTGVDQALGDLDRPMIFGTAALTTAEGSLFEEQEVWAPDVPSALANHAALLRRLRQSAGR